MSKVETKKLYKEVEIDDPEQGMTLEEFIERFVKLAGVFICFWCGLGVLDMIVNLLR